MAVDKKAVIKKMKGNSNKIDVLTLIEGYKKCATDNLKEKYLKDNVVVNPYIPFVRKMIIAKSIIKYSCFNDKGEFYIDSCKKYIMTVYELITNYTNININSNDIQADYDSLSENGLVNVIIALIPQHEFKEINLVIDMTYDDIMTNTYETHAYISNLFDKYSPIFKEMLEPIIDTVNEKIKEYQK